MGLAISEKLRAQKGMCLTCQSILVTAMKVENYEEEEDNNDNLQTAP